ncbi:methyltransferase domain-containing protein [Colletotrichum scovillei]|uniref:Methyltransferase domain-containing protein n=1 Tax=Colletotrichum scovillei TaxID=1209932 RepID=A0A9P7RED5_9PEZI|nr:methyltransferase domain-containing protein [Colletotrichum scovillei]KAG7075215.1 methyltransferase domain-containing protein [Colletotrichum scovillei]KAG7082215.1 methyltransferase domain-containing protein [Colletotrichum scovillei]
MQQTEPPHTEIEADDGISTGDLYEDSSVASLRSSILEHEVENGRTYHSMSSGKYQYPNDEKENDRLDVDFQHHIWKLTLGGALATAPAHKTAKRVLDMGTGTGIWACEYADEFPSTEVIGVDLSPIQPEWTPPNCIFEIDDLEKEWTWTEPFDYIHCRTMEGSFANPPKIIKKIYKALEPGGWFEAGGFVLPMGCDDGTVPKDSALARWHDLLAEAGERCGRSIESPSKYTSAIEEAGFVDIVNKQYVWPLNSWPKDEVLKEIGQWQFVNLDLGIEALSMGLLTRVMDWTKEEVYAFCAELRNDLKKKEYHAYWRVHVVYARKPLIEETPEEAPEE